MSIASHILLRGGSLVATGANYHGLQAPVKYCSYARAARFPGSYP